LKQIGNADEYGTDVFIMSGGMVNLEKEFIDIPRDTITGGILTENGYSFVWGDQTLSENFEIAAGKTLKVRNGASLTIAENAVLTNKGTIQNEGTLINNGKIIIENGAAISGSVEGNPEFYKASSGNIDVSTLTKDLKIFPTYFVMNDKNYLYNGNYTLTGETTHTVLFSEGEYSLTIDNLKIEKPNSYAGSAIDLVNEAKLNLVLANGSNNTLTGSWEGSAIRVNEGTFLNISGTGTLNANYKTGYNAAYSAAIGGYANSNFGTITINGGTIKASGTNGASIGSGSLYNTSNTMSGTIIINGGTVYADLIGNAESSGATLKVNGGNVYCNTIKADTSEVYGIIYNKNGTAATIYTDTTLTNDFEVPADGLTINDGCVLTVPEGKTLTIPHNSKITCYGSIVNNGTIAGSGTIDNLLAQANITGNGTVSESVIVKPVCVHSYNDWEPENNHTHKKTCTHNCGKILTAEHTFENDVCIDCRKKLPLRYDEAKKTLYILDDVTTNDIYESRNPEIEYIVITDGVKAIPTAMLYYLEPRELKSIHIPETLETIGNYAFELPIFGDHTVVYYCPAELKETIEENSGAYMGMSQIVFVSYVTDNTTIKITKVEIPDGVTIDSNAVLDTVLYGKSVYFDNGTLVEFPNTPHTHRIPQWVNNNDGTCSGSCEVCNIILTEDHRYTYTASENSISASCCCGYIGSLVITPIDPKTYNGEKTELSLDGAIDNISPSITYCCTDGCINSGIHTAKVILDNAEAVMQFEIVKADSNIGNVSADILKDSTDISKIVLTRDNTDIKGVLSIDAGQTLVIGTNEISYTFTPEDTVNYKTVNGKATVIVTDTISPTGKITVSDNSWTEFLNTITFGLVFNGNQCISVEAADSFSGIAKVEYYITAEAQTLDTIKDLQAEKWTAVEDGKITVVAEDAKQFICYVRITDKAGNISYISTNGAEFDTSSPVISGVVNGTTYYTTLNVTVTDKYLSNVTLNGNTVTGAILLEGNKAETYTIIATDKAGNTSTVVVNMAPISTISTCIDGKNSENITSDDRSKLQVIIDTAEELLKNDNLNDNEKSELENTKSKAEALLDVLDKAQNATETENTEKVENITADNVKPEDKKALNNAKTDLENALNNNLGNYTDEEISAIKEKIERIDSALKTVENAESVDSSISALPSTLSPDDDETVAIVEAAKKAYDALTDYEKTLISPDTKTKLEMLLSASTAYDIINGDGSSWTMGDTDPPVFVANGSFSKFVELKIDDILVDRSNYEVRSGSTIITLKSSYLETLSVGEHTITVVYTNGETDAKFTVNQKETTPEETPPPTGNGNSISLYILAMVVSCSMVSILVSRSAKRKFVR